MLETKKALLKDNEWIVCGKCGHKLGRKIGEKSPIGIEIKCHSCKTLNVVNRPKNQAVSRETKSQYKYPHCYHCREYKAINGSCMAKLRNWGLGVSCKAGGSRTCKSFVPLQQYEDRYKELKK